MIPDDNPAADDLTERIEKALDLVLDAASTDGDHHKSWFLDQIARVLTGDGYDAFVSAAEEEGDFDWDTGVAP